MNVDCPERYNHIKEGDIVEAYIMEEVKNNIITIFRSVFNGQNYADFRRIKREISGIYTELKDPRPQSLLVLHM